MRGRPDEAFELPRGATTVHERGDVFTDELLETFIDYKRRMSAGAVGCDRIPYDSRCTKNFRGRENRSGPASRRAGAQAGHRSGDDYAPWARRRGHANQNINGGPLKRDSADGGGGGF